METFGYDAADEEVLVWGPRGKGDNGGVELLGGVSFVWGGKLRDVLHDDGEADVVGVRIWFSWTLQKGLEVGVDVVLWWARVLVVVFLLWPEIIL